MSALRGRLPGALALAVCLLAAVAVAAVGPPAAPQTLPLEALAQSTSPILERSSSDAGPPPPALPERDRRGLAA